MSNHIFHVHVYGVDERILNQIQDEVLATFIRKHDPEMSAEIDKRQAEGLTFADAADEYCAEDISMLGRRALIAQIISEETGVFVEYHRASETGDEALGIVGLFPWEFNDKEKALTPEAVADILRPYCIELGVSEKSFKVDSYTIEYFG